mmetsp:Transcript_2100/g.3710  ORF Transcript_2100/g.3710 Transcript_2100/m.3710 type:complete len:179 (-) Transcript_2100:254-790(-)
MAIKMKKQQLKLDQKEVQIIELSKFKALAKKQEAESLSKACEIDFLKEQLTRLKISLLEYDKHINNEFISQNELLTQQLEAENAHLRKLLNISDDLFAVDPEEEKKKAAQNKRNILKSIDDKLKQAERKIQKKTSQQELYIQKQREGFDQFELDNEEYDMYRLQKLKEHGEMPKEMKS